MDDLISILDEFESNILKVNITPFSLERCNELDRVFTEKKSKIVKNAKYCICDDGCADKAIQDRIEPRVIFEGGVYKIYGNRSKDVFPEIKKIYKKFENKNMSTFLVGDFLYSLQHKYKIPNGRLPIKIGRSRITLDLNMETYIIYPDRQSNNVHYEVEI